MGFELSVNGKVTGAEQVHQVFIFDSNASGDAGALSPDSQGNFDWILSEADDPQLEAESRLLRMEAAKWSAATCLLGGYCINGEMPVLRVAQTIEGTRLLLQVEPSERATGYKTDFIFHKAKAGLSQVVFDLAEHQPVSVLIAGNPYRVGGNFSKGGVVGVEESLCVQSTLHISLRRAAKLEEIILLNSPRGSHGPDQPKAWDPYIPEQSAVISPNVQFFRRGPEHGFPFLRNPVEVAAVITIAMPNCNPLLVDHPLDVPEDPKEHRRLLKANIAAGLEAAAMRSRVVVIPELGCGPQQNDPKIVGSIVESLLLDRFYSAFSEVHFVVGDTFRTSCSSLDQKAGIPQFATTDGELLARAPGQESSPIPEQQDAPPNPNRVDPGTLLRRHSSPPLPPFEATQTSSSTSVRRHSSPPYASPIAEAQALANESLASESSASLESAGMNIQGRRHSSPPYTNTSPALLGGVEVLALEGSSGRRHSSPPYASPIAEAQALANETLASESSASLESAGMNIQGRRHSSPPYTNTSPALLGGVEVLALEGSSGRRHSSPPYASPIAEAQALANESLASESSASLESAGMNIQGRRHSSPPYTNTSPALLGGVEVLALEGSSGRRHSSPPYASPIAEAQALANESLASESSASLESAGMNIQGRRHSSPPYTNTSPALLGGVEVLALEGSSGRRHSSPPYASPIAEAQALANETLASESSASLESAGMNIQGRRHSSPPYTNTSPALLGGVEVLALEGSSGRRHSSPPYASPIAEAQALANESLASESSASLESAGMNIQGRRHSSPPYTNTSPALLGGVEVLALEGSSGRRHSSPPYASISRVQGSEELSSETSTIVDSVGLNPSPGQVSSPPHSRLAPAHGHAQPGFGSGASSRNSEASSLGGLEGLRQDELLMGQAQSGFDSSCSGKSRDSRHGSLGPVGAQTQQQFLSPDANESSGGTMLGCDLSYLERKHCRLLGTQG